MEDAFMDIKEHGVCVDKKKSRVTCNYCGKEVQGFWRLKLHLGGVRRDVTSCDQVTLNVRETFRSMVMKQMLSSPPPAKTKRAHKRGRTEISSSKSGSPEEGTVTSVEAESALVSNTVVYSPGVSEMMSESGGEIWLSIPGSPEALKEVEDHVKKIRDSWAVTGCSILLDAWVDDENGRDLVTFIADSPAGPVYLKSFDVSDIKSNTNALISMVDEVVDEVGVSNVVQIIACSASGWVGELGEAYVGNNKKGKGIFWSVSVSHCFKLMLLKIEEIDSLDSIVEAVNTITDYANSKPSVLKLVRDQDHIHGLDTDVSSEFEFFAPYLTVESIFRAKEELLAMFASPDSNREEDIAVSNLLNDSSLWETVERVLKCSSPLIHGLLGFSSADNNQHVGHIYDTMDVIKESIATYRNNIPEESLHELS